MRNIFGKKHTEESESSTKTNKALVPTQDSALVQVDVVDPTSEISHTIEGHTLTAINGDMELSSDLRLHLVATSSGQIFVSKAERHNNRVQSKIGELKILIGPTAKVVEVDPSTISEIYRVAGPREIQQVQRKTNDTSRMQREVLGIVANAARQKASDIHIIVNHNKAVVRLRVDGVIREIQGINSTNMAFEMLAAAFAMTDESDASYQLKSNQGARISSLKTTLPPGVQSLRLQFNPLANDGRYLIIRLLYSGDGRVTQLEDLGYNQRQINQIKTMTARPVGINVVSGPTGSGKSTTLKAILEGMIEQRNGEINVITVEDPPEYVIQAAQQLPVTNAKTQEERAEAFTGAISAALRSDPDIMMIGEIRDKASADLAVEGAISGHPIYASLHANTAMDILLRLRNMGIEDFKVFDSTIFSGLIGQRLVRKLCPHCRVPYTQALNEGGIDPLFHSRVETMFENTPEHLVHNPLYVANPKGCTQCTRGYMGRSVVPEIILPDDQFMELMRESRKREARAYWFTKLEGIDLLGAAWLQALWGNISPIDIEHTVALIAPIPEHKQALALWSKVEDTPEESA